jgi:pimeloyl-ACP methyl ester carboxylesterase
MIPVLDRFTFRDLEYEILSVPSFDGTPLHVERTGCADGPVILLANGIGVRWYGFAPVFERLAPEARVIAWDYRGMGGSMPLQSDHLEIRDEAGDALAVLDALAPGERVAALGWSMGVPVLVEAHRRDPERFSRLALVFGAPGLPFVHAFSPAIDRLIRGVLGVTLSQPAAPLLLRAVLSRIEPVVREFLYRIRFAGRSTDPELFRLCVEGVLANRLENYGRTLIGLCRHDGWDHLPDMRLPVWVAGGTADWVTPVAAMERMAALLPESSYHEVPDASHFGLLENHPGLLDNLADFLLH